MTSVEQWSLIVGFLMPLLIAVIQRPGWPTWARTVVGIGASVIGGLVTVAVTGSFSHPMTVLSAVLTVALASISFYEHWWKNTGVAPAIEHATSSRSDEGYGLITALGLVIAGVGTLLLIVAAAMHDRLSIVGAILLIIGLVVVGVSRTSGVP